MPSFRLSSANVNSPHSPRPICSRLDSLVKLRRPSDFLATRAIPVPAA